MSSAQKYATLLIYTYIYKLCKAHYSHCFLNAIKHSLGTSPSLRYVCMSTMPNPFHANLGHWVLHGEMARASACCAEATRCKTNHNNLGDWVSNTRYMPHLNEHVRTHLGHRVCATSQINRHIKHP